MKTAYQMFAPRDLRIDCVGGGHHFSGTCHTTHECDVLIKSIEIFRTLMPSTREMVWEDIDQPKKDTRPFVERLRELTG